MISMTLKDRIKEVLTDKPISAKELCETLNCHAGAIGRVLVRLRYTGEIGYKFGRTERRKKFLYYMTRRNMRKR